MKTYPLRSSITWLAALAASLHLVSCASTGDPYEDSIFFSPQLADQRHDRMRKDLAEIEHDTAASRASADAQGKTLSNIKQGNQTRRNQIARIKARIAALEQEKVALNRDIGDARKEGRDDAELLQQRSDIEGEIDGLNHTLQKLIQIQ